MGGASAAGGLDEGGHGGEGDGEVTGRGGGVGDIAGVFGERGMGIDVVGAEVAPWQWLGRHGGDDGDFAAGLAVEEPDRARCAFIPLVAVLIAREPSVGGVALGVGAGARPNHIGGVGLRIGFDDAAFVVAEVDLAIRRPPFVAIPRVAPEPCAGEQGLVAGEFGIHHPDTVVHFEFVAGEGIDPMAEVDHEEVRIVPGEDGMVVAVAEPAERDAIAGVAVHGGEKPAVADVAIEEEAVPVGTEAEVGDEVEAVPSAMNLFGEAEDFARRAVEGLLIDAIGDGEPCSLPSRREHGVARREAVREVADLRMGGIEAHGRAGPCLRRRVGDVEPQEGAFSAQAWLHEIPHLLQGREAMGEKVAEDTGGGIPPWGEARMSVEVVRWWRVHSVIWRR